MEQLLQQLVNGLTVGSVYALVALGYTMIYGILRLINFAHGELFMLGSYLALTLIVTVGVMGLIKSVLLGIVVVFLIGMGLVAVTGVVTERVAYRPLRKASRLAPLVSALGVSIFLQNAVMLIYGTSYQVYPEGLIPAMSWRVGGAEITLMRVLILVISMALMAALYFFVQKTRVGMAMRAVALDHDTARLMGINVDRIIMIVFLIGPALGAAAGIMVGLYYRQINFTMGWTYGLKAFTAAILGGIGNIPGAMLGGILLGVLETLGAGYVSTAWKDALAFVILILILILRPTGLLGERVAEKV
ncbi:MAG: branched-chain amino acid ABC transporter permease [Actinobacteria bacterium]|nr:branched-chain amino acid ABC transporter permease [Actinomycetota bacterium]